MRPLIQILLTLALVGVAVGYRRSSSSSLSNLASFLSLITALKYDQPCSYLNEQSRQNLTRELSAMSSSPRLRSQVLTTMTRFSNDVVSNNKQFCSAPELLICKKESLKCGCGDPGKEVLYPNTDSSRDYIVERDEVGVNRCRWTENTYCLSDDLLKAQGFGNMVNSKCQSGTKCISKADGEECSFHAVVAYVMSTGRRGPRLTVNSIMRDVYQGKICTCKPDPTLNTIHSEEDSDDWDTVSNDIRRRKRSTTVLEEIAAGQGEEEKMSAGVAPVLDIQAFFA